LNLLDATNVETVFHGPEERSVVIVRPVERS